MSNQYAQRVFSEHPITMWSFDEKVGFVNFISESDRQIWTGSWTDVNVDSSEYTDPDKENIPFSSSVTSQISPTSLVPLEMSLTLPSAWSSASVDGDVAVSAQAFIYISSNTINYIDFGSYDGVSEYDVSRNYFPETAEKLWIGISHHNLLYENLYMNISFKNSGGYTASDFEYLVNGLSVGQRLEAVASDTLGVEAQTTPATLTDLGILPVDPEIAVYEEKSFGVDQRSAYHVIQKNQLLSCNSAMPMVYGSSYLTRLRPASGDFAGYPSFIFDGCGMFTEQGRYDTYTLEFWLRVGGDTHTSRRILGPTTANNQDGLFICGGTISLSIGTKSISYSVGRYGDPMLIHIVYTPSAMSLLINGETVAEIQIDSSTITLPSEDNQFLAFYSYDDLDPIEIDALSIFGYAIPGAVAKRRFIWGQGVGEINLINSRYQGTGASSSFSAAKLTNSISYPDNAGWDSGSLDNLTVKRNKLTFNDPKKPTVVLASHTKEEWLDDLNTINVDKDPSLTILSKNVYINYHPNSEYDEEANYSLFVNPSSFCKGVDGLSMAVDVDELIIQESVDLAATVAMLDALAPGTLDTLLYLNSTQYTWDFLDACIWPILRINNRSQPGGAVLIYAISIDGYVYIKAIYSNKTTGTVEELGEKQLAFHGATVALRFSGETTATEAASFLRDVSRLEVVLGSDQATSANVNIHSFGFFNSKFYTDKIKSNADINPTGEDLEMFTAYETIIISNPSVEWVKDLIFVNYSYFMQQEFGWTYEDYGVRGTWEDYIPLSHLAGVVKDFEGNDAVALDSIQFNISYPSPKYESNAELPVSWTYADLKTYYEGVSLSYLYLGLYTGFPTYDALSMKSSIIDYTESVKIIDTSDRFVRTYVSLQSASDLLSQESDIDNTIGATNINTVYFQAFESYEDDRFEIYDGAILVPPRSKSVDKLSLVVDVDYAIPGVLTYPVEIKSLELASFAKDRNTFTAIKASSGKDIYPVVTNGVYYDNSAYNPFKIDKKGLPYLYLGSYSGFTPMGPAQDGWKKGLQIYMPEGSDSEYKLDSLQFWIRSNTMITDIEKTFLEFTYGNTTLFMTMQSFDAGSGRGIVRIYSAPGVPFTGGAFIQNGNVVANPVVDNGQWNAISFSFEGSGLSLGGNVGRITVLPGFSYNNISYFSVKSALGSTQISYRSWSDILADLWSDWRDSGLSWEEVLIAGITVLKAKELSQIVYKTYIGTEAISIESPAPIWFKQDMISSYPSSAWSSSTIIPV